VANLWLDIGGTAVVNSTFIPAALTTTTLGTTVDLIDSNANMFSAVLMTGAVSGTQGTFDVKLQESTQTATTGTWTDISGATFTQFTTSGVVGVSGTQIISAQRQKRYVRAYVTVAGTVTSAVVGVTIFSQRATTPSNEGGWQNEQGAS
jgi:hypothetical protein